MGGEMKEQTYELALARWEFTKWIIEESFLRHMQPMRGYVFLDMSGTIRYSHTKPSWYNSECSEWLPIGGEAINIDFTKNDLFTNKWKKLTIDLSTIKAWQVPPKPEKPLIEILKEAWEEYKKSLKPSNSKYIAVTLDEDGCTRIHYLYKEEEYDRWESYSFTDKTIPPHPAWDKVVYRIPAEDSKEQNDD